MIINSSKQSLICLFNWTKEILNVKWMLDYIKREFIYWQSWIAFISIPALNQFRPLDQFFKNNQKKSGLHKSQGVIGLDALTTKLNLNSLRPESL
jgi:hypothetical protein